MCRLVSNVAAGLVGSVENMTHFVSATVKRTPDGWKYMALADDHRTWKGKAGKEDEAWASVLDALARTGEEFSVVGDLVFGMTRHAVLEASSEAAGAAVHDGVLAPARHADAVRAAALNGAVSERMAQIAGEARSGKWRGVKSVKVPEGWVEVATDGSRRRGRGGVLATAWAWRVDFTRFGAGMCTIGASVAHAELHAVCEALAAIAEPVSLRVDHKGVAEAIGRVLAGEAPELDAPDCNALLEKLEELVKGREILVHWAPAHAGSLASAHVDILANWCARGRVEAVATQCGCGISAELSERLKGLDENDKLPVPTGNGATSVELSE